MIAWLVLSTPGPPRLRELIGAHVNPSDLDRVGGELLDETGVDVDGRHVGAAVGDPLHQRAAACADRDSMADSRSRS